jgi:hypothetical protein
MAAPIATATTVKATTVMPALAFKPFNRKTRLMAATAGTAKSAIRIAMFRL